MSAKELLPYIHVFAGPRGGEDIFLMATDASRTGMISKWHIANARKFCANPAIPEFTEYVDSRTLGTLQEKNREIVSFLASGDGSCWVTPNGLVWSKLNPII